MADESDQRRKLRAVNVGTALQRVDGISLIVATAINDGEPLDHGLLPQFRLALTRLSHLVEEAFRLSPDEVQVTEADEEPNSVEVEHEPGDRGADSTDVHGER